MTTTLLALTLNEIEGCKAVLPQINRGWCHQILIVDSGSTDGTVEWCRLNGFEVYEQKRRGIRYAYLEVMPLVSGDVMLTLSPRWELPHRSDTSHSCRNGPGLRSRDRVSLHE